MSKKLPYLGLVPLFVFTISLGSFLEFKNYSFEGFIIIYITIFCIPFFWALPLREMDSYDTFKATMYGLVSTIILGGIHLIHYLSDGSRESFLLIVPLIAVIELSVSENIPRDLNLERDD